MSVDLLILNYNGRRLLAECLPSVLRAAEASRHRCRVAVIDNDSTDDSLAYLAEHFPQVRLIRRPNRGLCSFNDVVPRLDAPVAILLNNDVKLDRDCIDPLVAPLLDGKKGTGPICAKHPSGRSGKLDLSPFSCFMTAPLCWRFDGHTYEGFKTAVSWHWGLVRATALFPGHQAVIARPGQTASAGAVLAVDCRKFAELGGFDPLYLPGRLEDLDLAFRAHQAGYHALYVPQAVAWHLGMATFRKVLGNSGCDQLALRNTLLFQWKNLRHPRHLLRQLLALPLRLLLDLLRAAWLPRHRRWAFARALCAAIARLGQLRWPEYRANGTIARQREFFRRFHPRRLGATPGNTQGADIRASESIRGCPESVGTMCFAQNAPAPFSGSVE